jgi:uncharacterized tellurite resistance protein B-like protein
MRFIREWLGVSAEQETSGGDTIRRIADELDKLDPARARYLASFAFVLARVAHADHDITDTEIASMESLISSKGGVSADQAALVVQMARTQQKLFGGTDDFLVTRELEKSATYEQKLALIDCLYAVASADERLLTVEGNEIARIGRELKVDQTDLSRLRSGYRRFIEASKGLE